MALDSKTRLARLCFMIVSFPGYLPYFCTNVLIGTVMNYSDHIT